MIIEQMYTNCLAHAAYYIESNGEAAIIDPLRDIDIYIEKTKTTGADIKYIFETHFHADFVSGHLDIARKTGAAIVFGPDAQADYNIEIAKDGQIYNIGDVKIKVLHTPGHTIESSCYLLIDESGKEYCVFTGDTLFVGDVGRPDLLSGNLNKEILASKLYDSINNKLKTLSNDVIVYPGHGPGSACGKNIGKETVSTIGLQRMHNFAMKDISRDEFINIVTSDLPAPPAYFFKDAGINKIGYLPFDDVIKSNLVALDIEQFKEEIAEGALVLDTRDALAFAQQFVPGSINIGLNGDFAVWVGTLIDFGRPIILICHKGDEKETIVRLARIGYENVRGYLNGGIQTWIVTLEDSESIPNLANEEYFSLINSEDYVLLDVRRKKEFEKEHLFNSVNIPLDTLLKDLNKLNKHQRYMVYCAGGYRSMIAASILKANNFSHVVNINGGILNVKNNVPSLIEVT